MEGFDTLLKIATFVAGCKKDLPPSRYLGQFSSRAYRFTLPESITVLEYFEQRLKHFYLKARGKIIGWLASLLHNTGS